MDAATVRRLWWAVVLRGLAAIVFGILAFVVPGLTLLGLILLFGAYALIEGVFNVIATIRGGVGDRAWWSLLLEGLVSIAAGLVTLVAPGLSALVLLYVMAAWAILTGALEIAAAIRLRKVIANEWWLGLSGALSVAFGTVLMITPATGALAVIWLIGTYAIVFGMVLVALGVRLRRQPATGRARMARAA
jgi:uncharacterized membrane protein HdeD (DUF308 family)